MKRMISVLLFAVIAVSAFALTSCGGSGDSSAELANSKYIGSWKATSMSLKDASEAFDDEWILTLNADGTGQFVSKEGPTDITWELTDNGFKTKGDTKLKFTDDGDNIKTKLLGVDMIFEKQ